MELAVDIFIIIKNFFLDLFFPLVCLGCQKKGQIICQNCQRKIPLVQRETEKDIIALYDYRDPIIKKLIWHLKYYHHPMIGQKLGEILYDELIEELAEIMIFTKGQKILVIPVPISKHKTKVRGYNQALKIAEGFISQANKQELFFEIGSGIVTKIIETIPQAHIKNRSKRLSNIVGVYLVTNKTMIKGRTIIIIDDVTTTGGTIKEIMKILKKAGARKVIGLTLAH